LESSGHSANNERRDPFHNGAIPICRLLNDAIEDIFPELKDHGNSNHGNHSKQPPQVESGSALGQMIRRRYLLSRKLFRASLDAKINKEKINDFLSFEYNNNNIDFHNNNNNTIVTPPTTTTAAKKKRKRKKKKRQESAASLPPTIITPENNTLEIDTNACSTATHSISRNNGTGSHFNDGNKSMMSTTDHSLEALDEALKNEVERMVELEANHDFPLLESLPSDDSIQAQESPSQFIDQIKPQDENIFRHLPDHMQQLPLTDTAENIITPSSLPEDTIPSDDDPSEDIWRNPLQLRFLVNVEGGEELLQCSGDDTQARFRDGSVPEGSQNTTTTFISDKERSRILLHEWIDQFFFMSAECECIETSVTEKHPDGYDDQKDEWDSFIQFCNERTVGKEKALGIPLGDLLDIGSSIECRDCREETLAEIKKVAEKESSAASASMPNKSSRVVMKSMLLDKSSLQLDNEKSFDAAFDYVALEEGNHIPNDSNEEKSDCDLSFLAIDVAIDLKQKKSSNKNSNKNKNSAESVQETEQNFFLETITSKQLEGFLYEWLIAGVDEEKLVQMSIRKESGTCESDTYRISFPVVASEGELQMITKMVIEAQRSFKKSLESMDIGLEKMGNEWKSKNPELNLDFSGMNTMKNCEESCNKYFTENVLPILIVELSLPSHACAELQIHLWALYLEVLGKTLNACDAYYKKLEEDLADQNGRLPLFVISAPSRELYRKFAEEKIGFLSEMGKSFSEAIKSLSMREFFTRSCWEQCKRGLQGGQVEQKPSSQKLDEDCRKLIKALTKWTGIVSGGRMSDINKERAKRLAIVFNMLRDVVESLGEEYKRVQRHFSQECQKYFTMLLSNIQLAHGVKHRMRLIEMDDVVSLTTGVILMWRHVRIMQSRVGGTVSAEILPLSLRKWILASSSIDLEPDERHGFSSHLDHSKCWRGIGGRRKTMGIFAGLTYVWLRERCKEWKAEIASQELLTSFDVNLLSSADQMDANASKSINKAGGLINKPRKKTKKKKGKKPFSVANGFTSNPESISCEQNEEAKSNDDLPHAPINSMRGEPKSSEDQCALVDKSAKVAKQESVDDAEVPIVEVAKVAKQESVDDAEVPIVKAVLVTNETERSVDANSVEFLDCEKEDSDDIEICESLVVVQDELGCSVPAMEFLTDRLLELMRQPENEKIVIVSS